MQAGQKLGIVYIGKAGGKVSAELFWSGSSSCKSYIFCPASEVEVVLENCWCYLIRTLTYDILGLSTIYEQAFLPCVIPSLKLVCASIFG